MSDDDGVGYGKPPKHTQFKPGQSGNPKGRPKGRKNMRTIVNDVLDRTVTISENGRIRKVKYMEAFAHQMAAKALNGTMRERIMFLKAINEYAPELLKEAEAPHRIIVEYVLPDGKTVASYDNTDQFSNTSDNDPKASPGEAQPDPRGGEDDSWPD